MPEPLGPVHPPGLSGLLPTAGRAGGLSHPRPGKGISAVLPAAPPRALGGNFHEEASQLEFRDQEEILHTFCFPSVFGKYALATIENTGTVESGVHLSRLNTEGADRRVSPTSASRQAAKSPGFSASAGASPWRTSCSLKPPLSEKEASVSSSPTGSTAAAPKARENSPRKV